MSNNPLDPYIRAGYAAIAIETQEELRLTKMVARMTYPGDDGKPCQYTVLVADGATKLREARLDESGDVEFVPIGQAPYPAALAETVKRGRTILLVHEYQFQIKQPMPQRVLKDAIPALKAAGSVAVLVAPSWQLPQELEKDVQVIRLPLATEDELSHALDLVAESVGATIPADKRTAILRAANGLTLQQAEDAFARAVLTTGGTFDPSVISDIKMETIRQSGIVVPEKPDPIGSVEGMSELLEYAQYEVLPAHGTDLAVRRLLCVGPPGTGKSSFAKMLASVLQIPLVSLSLSNLQSKWVGDSQANLKKALDIIDAMGYCVVWCDEAGDQFKGANASSETGNPIGEMVGELTKWMEEKQSRGTIMVFTANEHHAFPEKILSRMTEIWFVDLPNAKERLPIARCIMKRYSIPEEYIEPAAKRLAEMSDGWSGREIRDCIEAAARRTGRKITVESIEAAASKIKPLSVKKAEYIAAIREYGLAHLRIANTPCDAPAAATKVKRQIDTTGLA